MPEVPRILQTRDAPASLINDRPQGVIQRGKGYNNAVVFDQAGLDRNGQLVKGSIGPQTLQALRNVAEVFRVASDKPGGVYQVTARVATPD